MKQKATDMKVQEDKKKHFVAGFIITAVISLFFGYLVGAAAAIVAGTGKEVYDKVTGKGTPEALDYFVATAAGAVTAIAISLVSSLLWNLII